MKREIKVKGKGILAVLGIFLCLFWTAADMQYVQAAENENVSELSQLMTAEESVEMKAAPEDGAEVIVSYQKGDSIFVTGETADGWYRAMYQDKTGYIPRDTLTVQEIDVAALDEEMARTEQEAAFVVEVVERYRSQARRSKIWGGVIIVLVLAVFATGIISGVKGAKKRDLR